MCSTASARRHKEQSSGCCSVAACHSLDLCGSAVSQLVFYHGRLHQSSWVPVQGYSLDEEDPTTYQLRISYARPPQSGPGSQRVPTHVRRDAGPPRRGPQHDQRKDAHSRQADNRGPRSGTRRAPMAHTLPTLSSRSQDDFSMAETALWALTHLTFLKGQRPLIPVFCCVTHWDVCL